MYGHLQVLNKISGSTALPHLNRHLAGHLVLVVGPSGVGKDSVIAGLKMCLSPHPRVYFPSRIITRPADSGGEAHMSVSPESFERLQAAGGLFVSWSAHGHRYGIPADVRDRLRLGHCVICNVSRTVLDTVRSLGSRTHVLLLTASPRTLHARLRARAREDDADIMRRVRRAQQFDIDGDDVRRISNDGPLSDAVREARELVVRLLAPGLQAHCADVTTAKQTNRSQCCHSAATDLERNQH